MSSSSASPSPEQIKCLVDDWLRAELREDEYLRSAPDGEFFDAVIVHPGPPGVPNEIVETVGPAELEAFDNLAGPDQARRIGLSGQLLRGVTELDLRVRSFRAGIEGADRRHGAADASLAEQHVADLFRRAGLDVSSFSDAFERATRRMVRAHLDVMHAVEARDRANWRPDLDDDPASALLASLAPKEAAVVSLSQPVEQVRQAGVTIRQAAAMKIEEARKLNEFSSGRMTEYERAADLFAKWAGDDVDIGSITPAQAGAFREDLISYPTNASKRAAYRELSVPERVAKSKGDGDRATLSAQTVNGKYLDPLRGIFDWGKKTGRVATNPFDGITVSTARSGAGATKRKEFSEQQLQKLFAAPVFTGAAAMSGVGLYRPGAERVSDWRYWLPLMALYSGARLNELAGLLISDFEERDGVALFHVRPYGERGLKTEASERFVPLHAALIDLGLLKLVNSRRKRGEVRLFPDIKPGPRGHLSHTPSKFFARLIDKTLGDEAQVVFHSSRHTFITKMREAGVAREVRTALVGHDDGGTHEGYGSEPLKRLNEGVQSVTFANLDLSKVHLPDVQIDAA